MEMMRLYTSNDYPIVCDWWKSWGWDCVPEHALPKIGIVATNGKEDVCAAWLYQTDSSVATIEWFVSSKTVKKGRKEAMDACVSALCGMAKDLGYKSAVMFTNHPHLVARLERLGFSGRCDDLTHMGRSL